MNEIEKAEEEVYKEGMAMADERRTVYIREEEEARHTLGSNPI